MKKWKIFLSVCVLSLSGTAYAAMDWGFELGARQQGGSVAGPSNVANSQTGWQGGAFVHLPLEGGVAHFRTGLLYTTRPLQSENTGTGVKIDYHLDYVEVPLDILFKPNEALGFYLGFNIAMNVAKSCSGDSCKVNGVDTPIFPFLLGVTYKFTPKWGVDFYVDGANTNIANGLYDYHAVGLNLTFSMD
ncbi:MAG TPA: outer membrane beta-barrel protein [Bdellovibrio sp.]|nr:outer membrane beta-barrel protein [Bdellovibrio sp.]